MARNMYTIHSVTYNNYFWGFNVYNFVDLVKHDVLTHVSTIEKIAFSFIIIIQ